MCEEAYLAGLIDGEGTLTFNHGKTTFTCWMQITSTDETLIDWLTDTFGGTKRYTGKRQKANHKPAWSWTVHQKGLKVLLPRILPFLRVKLPHAVLLTEFMELRGQGYRGTVSQEHSDRQWEIALEIRQLNKRGREVPEQLIRRH